MSDQADSVSVLLLVTNTLLAERRSGIHKVAVELARNLPGHCRLDLVKWDDQDGQLRFADVPDFNTIFGEGSWPDGVAVRKTAHRVRYRFGELIDSSSPTWLLYPEIAYHAQNGNEILARIISQCREYNIGTSAIFYDLVPIKNPHYSAYARPHTSYVSELFRMDAILPISTYSGEELRQWFGGRTPREGPPDISAILLPELRADQSPPTPIAKSGPRDTIMLIGTVEPRKRQVEFLRALIEARRLSTAAASLKVFVAGSLHPDVAVAFRELIAGIPDVEYADYVPSSIIDQRYGRALFSAFASNDEGYGLPIAESLAHGVPCLCANFGSMAEIAAGGGCLTVDVNSLEAMTSAIIALAEDGELRAELMRQIGRRSFRTWNDYAREVVEKLRHSNVIERAPVVVKIVESRVIAGADTSAFLDWVNSDALVFDSADGRDAFIDGAGQRNVKLLLPPRMVVAASEAGAADTAERLCQEVGLDRGRRRRAAKVEAVYADLRQHYRGAEEAKPWFLRIIISTYNRAGFVGENVRWLLSTVATPGSDIQVVVVDNASTDHTLRRLDEFIGHPNYQLIRSTSNTGMLGNIKTCSTLVGAEYVWVTGDDDYIVPSEVESIKAALRDHLGVPLAFLNFGVYYRKAFRNTDSAATFISEKSDLAPNAAPSGLLPVYKIAEQHDNLFTAVYPIIWRSDILASCFNYPFSGKPFADLTESVPTSKIMLESYSDITAYWHKPIGIVGNAHNSWSRHRPRWHAFLMPLVFERAREAQVDPAKLYQWSQIHRELYHEAIEIARAEKWLVDLDETELEAAWRVYRTRLELASPRPEQPSNRPALPV